MSDKVWVSYGPRDSTVIRGFWAALREEEPPESAAFKERLEIMSRNDRGEPLSAAMFASRFYHVNPWIFKKSIIPYMCSGTHFVRADAAEILRQHDMGQGSLYPCSFYEHDKTRLVTDQVFCLNFGNHKDTVILNKSKVEEIYVGAKLYNPPYPPINGNEIVVRKSACSGPDIWVDPKMDRVFFVSDRLAKALQAAKLGRAFRLYPCSVEAD